MNLLPISDFYSKDSAIRHVVQLIKSEYAKGKKSTYNVSEGEINAFGYELLNSKKENDALEIFILNTTLYPNGYNTFDSLGECLLLLGRKAEGIKAYKKSLELNPKNESARKIVDGQR